MSTVAYGKVKNPHPNRLVVIGAGIVGSALAKHLVKLSGPSAEVVVLDRSLTTLLGSTGHAPGFVGQLNEVPTLTELAKRTVKAYLDIPDGFNQVGGLEVAETDAGTELLKARHGIAQKTGLPATLLTAEEAASCAPPFVQASKIKSGLLHRQDGTANASTITMYYRQVAQEGGAIFVEGDCLGINHNEEGAVKGVQTSLGPIMASKVFVTTGIWASQHLPTLSVVPVAHPYIHSPERLARPRATPFVRFPEAHVYARDHGAKDGLGSYNHAPIEVQLEQLADSTAIAPWEPSFDAVLSEAYKLLPAPSTDDQRHITRPASFMYGKAFNGVFAMTPDNLPFVGKVGKTHDGLWCAVAVWVTHAAGCAELLARLALGMELSDADRSLLEDLRPGRFDGQDQEKLREKSLSLYNNIYNKK
ncbi:FAD dependent oxidoreductase [Meredithblackwellia eburnea MCA 4105]